VEGDLYMVVSTAQLLPPQMLPAVPHIAFSIFNFAIPNIFAWAMVFGLALLAGWARLPKIFLVLIDFVVKGCTLTERSRQASYAASSHDKRSRSGDEQAIGSIW
jgi:hypothetical protein